MRCLVKPITILTPLVFAIPSLVGQAFADQYHYNDVLVGDRAAGLAGAYTAISDDPSGLFYNPAGITRAPEGQLSASANAYNQTSYKYGNINEGGHTWERRSNTNFANFFGAFQPVGDGMFGFSIAVPDSNKASQDETFHNYQAADPNWQIDNEIINYKEDDTTVLFGPSYALKLNDSLSIGGTLYGHLRNAEWSFRQDTRASKIANGSKVYDILFQKFKTSEFGIKPTFGVMWDASQDFSFGLTVSQTFLLTQDPKKQDNRNTNAKIVKNGSTTTITQVNTYDAAVPNPQNATDKAVGMQEVEDRELPTEIKMGLAWFASPTLIVSADIQHFSATDSYASVTNLAVGSEYFFSPRWSMRAGVHTNNSNNKDLTQAGYDVDELGLTLSGSMHNRLSVLTFGLNYASGTGDAILNTSSNRIQTIDVQSITAYIATSMNF